MFLTAVSRIALVSLFFISTADAQIGQNYFLFIASTSTNDLRIVSDMHVNYTYSSRDTIQIEINILENWTTKDSLKTMFIRDISTQDTVMVCQERTVSVDVYTSASGDRIFLQKPEKFEYFDNYGQQQTSWLIDYAAVEFQNSRKKYNSVFTCYYGK